MAAWQAGDFRDSPRPARVGNVAGTSIPMKKDLHPKYNPVVFVDMTTGKRFISPLPVE